MSSFIVQIEDNPLKSIQIETSIGNNPASIEVQTFDNNIIQIESGLTLTPPEVAEVLNTRIVDFLEAGSGIYFNINNDSFTINSSTLPHLHSANDIVGLSSYVVNNAPVRNILASSGVFVENNSGIFSISLSTSGLQPSGNYSLVGHNHVANDITNFESAVSGYAPVKSVAGKYGTVTLNKGDVGLSNVDNTSDLNKPISTSVQIALDTKQPSGNYSLIGHSHSSSDISNFNSSVSGLLPVKNVVGNGYIGVSNSSGNYTIFATGLQPSGNYASSIHSHAIGDVTGLQTALDSKALTSHIHDDRYYTENEIDNLLSLKQSSGNYSLVGHVHTSSDITNFSSSVSGLVSGIYAPLNSPSLTGIPTAPTASSGTSNNQIASTQFVRNELSNLVNAAPTALDTLNELAIALGNDANFSTTVTNSLAQKANISGTSFTGSVTAPSGNFTVLQQNGVTVSVNGHTHNVSSITDFNSSVSGLLPVTNITGGTNISVVPNGTNFTVSVSGQLGLTAEEVDDRVNSLLVSDTGIVLSYNDNANTLTISTSGLQPSGNYSLIGHSHTSSDITNFNSSVSGLLPVKNVIGSGYVNVSSTSGNYTVSVSGLQPSGNYANAVHAHTSSDITNFNSSVSGLLPLTNIVGGTNISVVPSGTVYTVSVSGSLGLTTEEVDDRVSNLLIGGSGIVLNYNDSSNTLTINSTSTVSGADEIEEYATTSNFPASGNANIIYVATNTGQLFKWDGEFYYEAGPQGASTGIHGTQHDSDGIDPIPLTEYNVPQFTANTNNLNHLNKDILYITADANNRELTGLLAPTFCCVKLLVNISSTNTIIINNQSTNSDPANRFLIYTGADYYLLPGQSLSVVYSTEATRWRVL
jgi:hypothetical protein